MTSDLNVEPRTQSGTDDVIEWKRAHPVYMVTALLRNLRGFIIPFVIVAVSGNLGDSENRGSLITMGILALIVLITAISGVFEWRFYRYALTPQRLLVNSGLISKQERSIPYQRIQTVDLEEAPLDRIFGVAKMRIETAAGGSGDSEVKLQAVKREEALVLREQLLRARSTTQTQSSDRPVEIATGPAQMAPATQVAEGELLRALSFGQLLFAGATSGTIGPAAAVIGVGIQFAEDLMPSSWWDRIPWDSLTGASANLTVIAVAFLLIAALAWILAIGGTVLTYYGFELRRDGDHLMVQYGLLDRRRSTIPIGRIQAIEVSEGILRQPFGMATVNYKSAGGSGQDESSGSGVLFPFMPRNAIQALLAKAAPEFAVDMDETRLERLPKRALPRYVVADVFWTLVGVGLLLALIRWWQDGLPVWGYIPLILVPIVALLGGLAYHDAGWALRDHLFVMRTRSTARSTVIMPRRRIQHRRTTANPLQRRVSLATVHVAVAAGGGGGHFSLAHLDKKDGEALLHLLNPRWGR